MERYGNKVIQFENTTESPVNNLPYFRINNNDVTMREHIKEIVTNVYIMSQVKLLICPKSNLSAFSILINPELQYSILQ